ncbi:MAG: hypothetical protein AAB271_02920 [Nitrospirota bacterium]|jgi:sulfur relay (sulfurtransferase) complex TusBCD TusD component (DsrE family)
MKILLIVNDAPYGSEKLYNALRLAQWVVESDKVLTFNTAQLLQCRA